MVTHIYSTFAICNDGNLYVTGSGGYGQFGLGNKNTYNAWQKTLSGVKDLFIDSYASFAVCYDGALYVTGYNGYGNLGIGNNNDISSWEKSILNNVVKIESVGGTSYALCSNGYVMLPVEMTMVN